MFVTKHEVEFNGIKYVQKHGNPFDCGLADSYYHREIKPHHWPEGTCQGEIVDGKDMTPAELVAYMAGYEWNEKFGDKKSWD